MERLQRGDAEAAAGAGRVEQGGADALGADVETEERVEVVLMIKFAVERNFTRGDSGGLFDDLPFVKLKREEEPVTQEDLVEAVRADLLSCFRSCLRPGKHLTFVTPN